MTPPPPPATPVPPADRPADRSADRCPVCDGRRLHYAFARPGQRVVACTDCGLLFQNPLPHPVTADRATGGDARSATAAAVRRWVELLGRYAGPPPAGARLLVVGDGDDAASLAADAGRRGYDAHVTAAHLPPPADPGPTSSAGFDACVLADALDRSADPLALLAAARTRLKPDGVLAIVCAAGPRRSAWPRSAPWWPTPARPRFAPDRLLYLDPASVQTLLYRGGFDRVVVRSEPSADGRMVALARASAAGPPDARRPVLSVVLPAYNEAATVGAVLDAVLRKRVPGADLQLVVVESNSTDDTRSVVRRHAEADPRVTLVLQDRPRGKGHAVRAGLARATGDVVLIQDADLEYDVEDYDALLEPILGYRRAFVLGSRHGGRAWWKMRQFAGQWGLGFLLNCGHWVFTALLNALFRQRLRDPFTMYKVFRRDCLYGLTFRCDRFDFDHELLVKLVRKGYQPTEIPVNYRSRSFREGKKVSVFRDPWTWLVALARLRFTRVDPLRTVEQERDRPTPTGTARSEPRP